MKIDSVLQDIHNKLYSKTGSTRGADAALTPLLWYIYTGRAPMDFERKLLACTARQKSTIANRLIKHCLGSYDDAINSICNYLGFKRNI